MRHLRVLRLSPRSKHTSVGALLLGTIAIFATLPTAVRGNGDHEPISIAVEETAFADDTLLCDVQLDGGPAHITITSDPPGAVYYEGTLATAHAVVEAQTSPDAAPGPVVVTVKTDGVQTASDVTYLN